jgi:transcriptional regulator with XRE-family HTH domain
VPRGCKGPPGDFEARLGREVGARLREARDARGWTQERAAREAGLSVQFYGRLERGCALPALGSLRDLAEALEVPVGALLGTPAAPAGDPDPPELRRLARALRAASPGALRAAGALLDLVGAPPDPGEAPETNGACASCAGEGCAACGGWGMAPLD